MIHAIILSITGFQVKSGSFSIVEKIGETTAHLFPFLCTHGTEVIDHKWLIVVWLITVALLVAVSVAFFLMFTFQSRLKAEVRLHTSELDEQNRKLVDEINRRTIAEKTLVESRNLYKTLVENIPQSVFLKDTQSRFISVNRMFAHQVGCAQIEIEGKTDFDFYHPEHAEKYRADDQKVILSGETLIVTEPISYNGLNRWIRTIKTPVRNDQGTIIGVLGVFWDITEEKISSDSILASKLFTERIMTTTPVIVFVHDLFEKKNIYVNEAVIPILGYTPDEVLTLSANFLFQLIHPDDIDCLRDAVRKWGELNDDNETVSIEFRLHHKNGNWLWFMAKDTIFKRNESGKINQIIGTLSDITERKNAETALRSAMDRAQLYLDIVEVIIVALNRNGNISLINRKGCQILGYRLDEILGRNWFATCIPETERQSTEHFFKQLIDGQTENIEYHEYTICSKTGENRIIAWHNSVLHNEAGIVNATLSSGIDITERKFTEKRLIIEERRDHAILEIAQIPNASIQKVIDLSLESALSITESLIGYIYFYNEHSKKFTLFSWSHSVMPQCKIVEKQTTYDLEKTGLWGEAVRQRKPIVTNDYDAPSAFKKGIPSGHVPLGRHMNIPVFDDGEIVAVVGVGNKREPYTDSDVRHLTVFMDGVWKVVRRLEAENHLRELNEDLERTVQERTSELRNAKERAEQADRAKSEFLANMSHELRTPLNAVIGFGELLERQIKDPTHRGYVSSIASSGKNLLRLINDVLDMSKIEANRLELHPISTSIRTLIEDTGTIFQMKLEQKKITFSSIVEKTVPDFLLLDEARLRQILLNIVGNAVKFTEHGGIELVACLNNNDLIITVNDTGPGISLDHQELIFEPFRQAPGQSSHYGGTGLGLSISRKLIELMNGTLTLVSTPGKGSSFIITVKNVEQVCAVTPLAHTGQIESLHFKAALVLIADDVQSNCDVITALLAETGLQTIVATHGKKAVEISKNEKPDLILMDIRMPIMDGIEAARKIKEDPQTAMIPIIALTASGSTTDVNLAGNPDFSGRLLKPVTRSSIQKEISRHLQVTEEQQFSEEVVDLVISEPEELVTIFNQSIMPKAASLSGAVKTAQLRDFAKEVNELAISYANYELQKIAEHLASAVNSFDITKIREILAIISKK